MNTECMTLTSCEICAITVIHRFRGQLLSVDYLWDVCLCQSGSDLHFQPAYDIIMHGGQHIAGTRTQTMQGCLIASFFICLFAENKLIQFTCRSSHRPALMIMMM